MSFSPSPYLVWYLIAAAAPIYVAFKSSQHAEKLPGRWMALMLGSQAMWTVLHGFEVAATGLQVKLWLDNLQLVPMCIMPAAAVAFAQTYARRSLSRPPLLGYALFCAMGILFVFTAELHGLARQELTLISGEPFPSLHYRFEFIDYLLSMVVLGTQSTAVVVLIRYLGRVHRTHSSRILPIIIGVALPVVGGVTASALSIRVLGQRDVTFTTTALAAVLLHWGFFRKEQLTSSPIARDAVFELIPTATLVINKDNILVDLNNAAIHDLGVRDISKALGRHVTEFGPPTGELEQALITQLGATRELPIREDGIIHEAVCHPLGHDGARVIFVRDVTAIRHSRQFEEDHRNHLEEKIEEDTRRLIESELRFKAVFEQTFQYIAILSRDGNLLRANTSAMADSHDLGGEPPAKRLEDAPWWRHSRAVQNQLRSGVADAQMGNFVRFDTTYRTEEGEIRTADFSLKPVTDATGKLSMIIAEGRDVTELRSAEERLRQAQKMDALGRLAGGVAHDFNNLLTVICGNTSLLKLTPNAADAPELLDQIEQATQTAASLTRQMLSFSRNHVVQPQDIDVVDALERIVQLTRRTLPANVEIKLSIPPGLQNAHFDDAQLQQVLLNLAVNARDAMPNGGTLTFTTTIETHPSPEAPNLPKRWVRIDVSDTGMGMSPEQTQRIFEPFYTTKEVGKGTGLGLAMVYGALGQHGGFVSVESQLGQGTVFSVFLPCAKNASSKARASRISGISPPAVRADIVVVDDDVAVRHILERTLASAGHRISTYGLPSEALAASETVSSPALLICDLMMPEFSGFELVERVRANWPRVSVLFISGYSDDSRIPEAVHQGAAFLGKPFGRESLLAAVEAQLEGLETPTAITLPRSS